VVTGTLPAGTVAVGDTLAVDDVEVRVRGIEALEVARPQVSGVARVALDLGGRAPAAIRRGTPLVTPDAFRTTSLVDVRTRGADELPEQPVLHLGSAAVAVRSRPLGTEHARLRLQTPLPLRVGDRALLRDPGSRRLWGITVVDPVPPPIDRRGAATDRAQQLAGLDGSLAAQLDLRGVVRRSELVRIGLVPEQLPDGALGAGDWVVGPRRAEELRGRLVDLVQDVGPLDPPISTAVAATRLGIPDPALVSALVAPPLRERQGVLTVGEAHLPDGLATALAEVQAQLGVAAFDAPDRSRLLALGLDTRALAVLERGGHLLRVGEDVVLLPGADREALELLRELPQPFTTSEARRALGTTRRVALPLLGHLDRSGATVRLADDRRRLRG
jgi:selenocysteine-specific elongation factor